MYSTADTNTGWTIFAHSQGSGYIFNTPQEIESLIKKVPVTINQETIEPGTETDLSGYFCRKLKYLGCIDSDEKQEMIFEIGSEKDLFGGSFYYQAIFRIQENRIFEMYGHGFGRDHWYKNGKWK